MASMSQFKVTWHPKCDVMPPILGHENGSSNLVKHLVSWTSMKGLLTKLHECFLNTWKWRFTQQSPGSLRMPLRLMIEAPHWTVASCFR